MSTQTNTSTRAAASRTAPKGHPTPKRPRQGISGNPAKRAAAQATPQVDTAAHEAAAKRPARSIARFVAQTLAVVVLVGGYTVAAVLSPVATDSLVLIALLCVPALVTMLFVPPARSRGLHRWPVAWVLGFTSMYPLPVLIAAQVWVVWRFWVIEYVPMLPAPLRRTRGRTDDAAADRRDAA